MRPSSKLPARCGRAAGGGRARGGGEGQGRDQVGRRCKGSRAASRQRWDVSAFSHVEHCLPQHPSKWNPPAEPPRATPAREPSTHLQLLVQLAAGSILQDEVNAGGVVKVACTTRGRQISLNQWVNQCGEKSNIEVFTFESSRQARCTRVPKRGLACWPPHSAPSPRTVEAQDVGVAQVRLDLDLAAQLVLHVGLLQLVLEQHLVRRGGSGSACEFATTTSKAEGELGSEPAGERRGGHAAAGAGCGARPQDRPASTLWP